MKTIALFALATVTLAHADINWPEFRGPRGDGSSDSKGLPTEFGEGKNVKWKTPVSGKAWSSPVVWGNDVWATTASEDGKQLGIVRLDLATGKVTLDQKVFDVATPQFCHKFNSYGSPTPVIEEGRIYVSFGSVEILSAIIFAVLVARRLRGKICSFCRLTGAMRSSSSRWIRRRGRRCGRWTGRSIIKTSSPTGSPRRMGIGGRGLRQRTLRNSRGSRC